MLIDDLLARCPRYSRVCFCHALRTPDWFAFVSAGDAIELLAVDERGRPGTRLVAIVVAQDDALRRHGTPDERSQALPSAAKRMGETEYLSG